MCYMEMLRAAGVKNNKTHYGGVDEYKPKHIFDWLIVIYCSLYNTIHRINFNIKKNMLKFIRRFIQKPFKQKEKRKKIVNTEYTLFN